LSIIVDPSGERLHTLWFKRNPLCGCEALSVQFKALNAKELGPNGRFGLSGLHLPKGGET
jgi:hypothetical protein